MDRILLTGGFGYVGSHTAALLAEKGEDFLIYDNFLTSKYSVLERFASQQQSEELMKVVNDGYQGILDSACRHLQGGNLKLGRSSLLSLTQIYIKSLMPERYLVQIAAIIKGALVKQKDNW